MTNNTSTTTIPETTTGATIFDNIKEEQIMTNNTFNATNNILDDDMYVALEFDAEYRGEADKKAFFPSGTALGLTFEPEDSSINGGGVYVSPIFKVESEEFHSFLKNLEWFFEELKAREIAADSDSCSMKVHIGRNFFGRSYDEKSKTILGYRDDEAIKKLREYVNANWDFLAAVNLLTDSPWNEWRKERFLSVDSDSITTTWRGTQKIGCVCATIKFVDVLMTLAKGWDPNRYSNFDEMLADLHHDVTSRMLIVNNLYR